MEIQTYFGAGTDDVHYITGPHKPGRHWAGVLAMNPCGSACFLSPTHVTLVICYLPLYSLFFYVMFCLLTLVLSS